MAFIREEITSEEDKTIFNSFNFKYPLKNTPINPNVWTIDRQRNVFLAGLGGGIEGDIPLFYVLGCNKNVIIFSLYFDINNNTKTGEIERTWKILKILAPKGLEESNKEIIAMIKEALIAYYLLPVEKRHNAQFFFEFKTNPQYVLGCHEYNSEGLWNRL